jgi:RNA polymerase sigma-70 factor, ECF subfamily
MNAEEHRRLEEAIRAKFDANDLAGAATTAIAGYGPQIFGYLVVVSRSDEIAAEVFSDFCHDLWRDLPSFRWAASLRTWAYTIARHRLHSYLRDPSRRKPRVAVSQVIDELAAKVRTTTAGWQRSEVKDAVARVREQLDPDDQTLLTLRIDRDLPWKEVAAIMEENEAALRKRFERLKVRLRELARKEELL